jgi:hypothetical protein
MDLGLCLSSFWHFWAGEIWDFVRRKGEWRCSLFGKVSFLTLEGLGMSQVRLSFEGSSAIALAELLRGFPGYTVEVEDAGLVRGDGLEKAQKVMVTLTAFVAFVGTSAEAGSNVIQFLEDLQAFQGSSQAVEKIVVIPEAGDRQILDCPSGDALVEAVRLVN